MRNLLTTIRFCGTRARASFCICILLALTPMHADFVSGSAACPASGNKVVSSTGYNLYQITVNATTTNTGKIYLGGPNVDTSSGGVLVAGASYTGTKPTPSINPSGLFFACDRASSPTSDGITWIGVR